MHSLKFFRLRKGGIDSTVYDAIQLSIANNIPWFCMYGAFPALHCANKSPTENVAAIVLQAMSKQDLDLLLYAVGALLFAFTTQDLHLLAKMSNPLTGFTLFQLIKNH